MPALSSSPYRSASPPRTEVIDKAALLEVIVLWGDEVLAVEHLRPGEDFRLGATAAQASRRTRVFVHPHVIGSWPLAEHRADGRCVVRCLPSGPRVETELGETLEDGACDVQHLGAITFAIRRTGAIRLTVRAANDTGWRVVLAIAATLLALTTILAGLSTPLDPRIRAPSDAANRGRALVRGLARRWPGPPPDPHRRLVPDLRYDESPRTRRRARDAVGRPHFMSADQMSKLLERAAEDPVFFMGLLPWECESRRDGSWSWDGRVSLELIHHSDDDWIDWRVGFQAWLGRDGRLSSVRWLRGESRRDAVLAAVRRFRARKVEAGRWVRCTLDAWQD